MAKSTEENARTNGSSTTNSSQVGGDHYKRFGELQPWDFVLLFDLGFFEGNILKYLVRWKHKGGIEDLRKARHYLEKLIETQILEEE